jgi:hypothetical protein
MQQKFDQVTLTYDLENQKGSRISEGLSMYQVWSKFKGQGHRVKFLPHTILVNTLESTPFNGF